MSNVPQTFAEWSAHGAVDVMSRSVINALIANDPFLASVPLQLWPGGESYEYVVNKTTPTIAAINETTTMESTQAKRFKVKCYLSQYGGEVETPVFLESTLGAGIDVGAEDALDLVRAMGIKLRNELITGAYMTEANVTITGTGIAATPGFDAVTAVSANMPTGMGDVTYTHSGTLLKFRAPGSSTYGAGVDISGGDGDFTLYDGDDTTKYVTVTVDVSDFTGGAVDLTCHGALTFQRPEAIAGLKELAALDSNQVKTPGTNGDPVTLAILDELEEMCLGPKSEKVYVMNARTRRAVKTLIAAAGGATPFDHQGLSVSKYALHHEGVPIVACPGVSIAETQGSCSTCGRIYCIRLNRDNGFGMFYGAQRGPNMGVMSATSDDDIEGGPLALPVYMRLLGERESIATYKWRLTGAFATYLKNSKSCSMRYGITS